MTRSATFSLARKVPLWRSSWSTSVVLPWSTWAMMAMLRIWRVMRRGFRCSDGRRVARDERADLGGAEQAGGDQLAAGDVGGAEESAGARAVDAHRRRSRADRAGAARRKGSGRRRRATSTMRGQSGDERVDRQQARIERGLVEAARARSSVVGRAERRARRCRCGGAPRGGRRSRAPRRCLRRACGCRCPCCTRRRSSSGRPRPSTTRIAWIVIRPRLALELDAGARIVVERLAVALERRMHRRDLRRSSPTNVAQARFERGAIDVARPRLASPRLRASPVVVVTPSRSVAR